MRATRSTTSVLSSCEGAMTLVVFLRSSGKRISKAHLMPPVPGGPKPLSDERYADGTTPHGQDMNVTLSLVLIQHWARQLKLARFEVGQGRIGHDRTGSVGIAISLTACHQESGITGAYRLAWLQDSDRLRVLEEVLQRFRAFALLPAW
jgi:hypothetical protein